MSQRVRSSDLAGQRGRALPSVASCVANDVAGNPDSQQEGNDVAHEADDRDAEDDRLDAGVVDHRRAYEQARHDDAHGQAVGRAGEVLQRVFGAGHVEVDAQLAAGEHAHGNLGLPRRAQKAVRGGQSLLGKAAQLAAGNLLGVRVGPQVPPDDVHHGGSGHEVVHHALKRHQGARQHGHRARQLDAVLLRHGDQRPHEGADVHFF